MVARVAGNLASRRLGVGIEVSRKDLDMKTFKSYSAKIRRLVW